MNYKLVVDGHEDEVNLLTFENETGKLDPESEKNVKFTVSPGFAKVYNLVIGVDVLDVGENVLHCPLTFESQIPAVSTETVEVNIGRTFLDFPYSLGFANLFIRCPK